MTKHASSSSPRLLVATLLAMLPTTSIAAPLFDEMIIFGDSVSDIGNFQALVTQFPFARLSNGPLLVEYLSSLLELPNPVEPSLHLTSPVPQGNNFAYIAANAVDEDPDTISFLDSLHLPVQVGAFLASVGGVAPSDGALYFVFIGANDVLVAGDLLEEAIGTGLDFSDLEPATAAPTSKSGKKKKSSKAPKSGSGKKSKGKKSKDDDEPIDFSNLAVVQLAKSRIELAAAAELFQLELLIGAQAQNFVIMNPPDVSAAPTVRIVAEQKLANATTLFDQELAKALPEIQSQLSQMYIELLTQGLEDLRTKYGSAITLAQYDLQVLLDQIIANGAAFGFSNVVDPCLFFFTDPNQNFNPECTPPQAEGFLWWDEAHLTTSAHALGAQDVFELIVETFA